MSECRMLGIVLAGTVLGGGVIGFALYLMRPSLQAGSGWTPTLWLGVGVIITTLCMVLAIVAIVSNRLEEGWGAASRIAREAAEKKGGYPP